MNDLFIFYVEHCENADYNQEQAESLVDLIVIGHTIEEAVVFLSESIA